MRPKVSSWCDYGRHHANSPMVFSLPALGRAAVRYQFSERVGAMGACSRPGRGAVFRAGRAAVSLRLGGVGEREREAAEGARLSALVFLRGRRIFRFLHGARFHLSHERIKEIIFSCRQYLLQLRHVCAGRRGL